MRRYPLYLGGQAVESGEWLPVRDKYKQETFAEVALARLEEVEQAIEKAFAARKEMASLPAYERKGILEELRKRCREKQEELAEILTLEVGKPIQDSRKEVARFLHTLEIAAEEAARIGGEVLPLDRHPVGKSHIGYTKRYPVGVCSLIVPFNFPLNLAAHKFAPAIAAGCPFLWKPSPHTPVSACVIGEMLSDLLPPGAFSILPSYPEAAEPLVTHPKVALLSFTGSQIGWELKSKAGRKKVILELGGNAACVVDETAKELEEIAKRIAIGAFYQSGQVCISIQRIFVHSTLYEKLLSLLLEEIKKMKMGDPKEEDTFLGPMISEEAARRVESWVKSALEQGAQLLCGGERKGAFFSPTLLTKVPADHPLSCEEVFGPVAVLETFEDFDQALEKVNEGIYGLQAGVFTSDLFRAHRAWDTLEVGGVMVNEIPTWRIDHMPYGGVKASGFGREGVRWVIEEMTELRLMVVRL